MSANASQQGPQQIYQEIGQALVSVAPPSWGHLTSVYRKAGKTAQSQSVATMTDGSAVGLRGLPRAFDKSFSALRELLYQADKGTWYTASCTVTSDGRISFDFDYDSEPDWSVPVVPGTYVEDLEMFPRAADARPEWLQQKLVEAGAQ